MIRTFSKAFAFPAIILLLSAITAAPAYAKSLLFPLKYQKSITATFGEYRIGHPHAGLDFSTGLQNGRSVIASDSGEIIRIKVSYFGYGRVLYQRTSDGRILVYAHLSGFSSKIDKIVRAIQKKKGKYTLSRFFPPGEIPVKRGEVIGFSGDTGTDVPHLHFEVRDKNNITINPLLHGLSIPDSIPPAIQKLHVEPIEYDAHVNGSWHEQVFDFKKYPDGSYYLEEPIRIGGRAGLSVQVTDFADNTNRLLNPYSIELRINDKKTFLIRYDKFDYLQKSVSELDYIYRLREKKRGTFHRLYRLHDRIVFHPEDLMGDLTSLSPGHYSATIIATDANGNKSQARFKLTVNSPPKIAGVRFVESGDKLTISVRAADTDGQVTRVSIARNISGKWEEIPAPALGKGLFEAGLAPLVETTDFRIFAKDNFGDKSSEYTTAYAPNAPEEPLGEVDTKHTFNHRGNVISLLLLRNAGFSYSPELKITLDPPLKSAEKTLDFVYYQEKTAIRINARIPKGWLGGTYRVQGIFKSAQGIPYSGYWELPVQMITTKGSMVSSADGAAQMAFPAQGAYSDLPCLVKKAKVRTPSWLEKITDAYEFSQMWEPMRKKPRIAIAIPENTKKLHEVGLYLNDRGVWWYLGKDRSGKKMAGRVSHAGTFALMRDISPPDIGDITPTGVVDDLKPTITVLVKDSGTGIFGGGIDFRIDGQSKIVEWHPMHGWLKFSPEKPLSVGTHKVVVTISDRAGNTSTRSGSFTISR